MKVKEFKKIAIEFKKHRNRRSILSFSMPVLLWFFLTFIKGESINDMISLVCFSVLLYWLGHVIYDKWIIAPKLQRKFQTYLERVEKIKIEAWKDKDINHQTKQDEVVQNWIDKYAYLAMPYAFIVSGCWIMSGYLSLTDYEKSEVIQFILGGILFIIWIYIALQSNSDRSDGNVDSDGDA